MGRGGGVLCGACMKYFANACRTQQSPHHHSVVVYGQSCSDQIRGSPDARVWRFGASGWSRVSLNRTDHRHTHTQAHVWLVRARARVGGVHKNACVCVFYWKSLVRADRFCLETRDTVSRAGGAYGQQTERTRADNLRQFLAIFDPNTHTSIHRPAKGAHTHTNTLICVYVRIYVRLFKSDSRAATRACRACTVIALELVAPACGAQRARSRSICCVLLRVSPNAAAAAAAAAATGTQIYGNVWASTRRGTACLHFNLHRILSISHVCVCVCSDGTRLHLRQSTGARELCGWVAHTHTHSNTNEAHY